MAPLGVMVCGFLGVMVCGFAELLFIAVEPQVEPQVGASGYCAEAHFESENDSAPARDETFGPIS